MARIAHAIATRLRRHTHRQARRRTWRWKASIAATTAMLLTLLMATVALASHGSQWINLTDPATTPSVEHNGAIFVQGGMGAGTGNFDPFLTQSTNADSEKGYNTTSASGEFDTFFGGGRTHPILASAIPAHNGTGPLYREITLDANDQGADDYMSINALKVFLDDQDDLTGYNDATNSFSSDTGSSASLIYDLDAGGDTTVLMRSQTLSPGSGVSDITVLIPDSVFPAECYYGSSTCGLWFYLYVEMGDPDLDDGGEVAGDQDWNVTAGFEEWRTELAPVVDVSKTADVTVTRTYAWTVDKKVNVDDACEDSASVELFTGDSVSAEWCIDVTRDAGTLSSPAVSGTITIVNPTGGAVIEDDIPANITSVTDVISGLGAVSVDCGVTFPYELDAGDTLECTYSTDLPDATNRTNTVTVEVEDAGTHFEATADIDFAAATVTEVDATATLTDDEGPLSEPFSDSGSTSYTVDYACDADEGDTVNTAVITGDDTGATDSDSATLTLTCKVRPAPAIDIEKATNGEDADSPTGPEIIVGDAVNWTYEVTNAGNVALTDVAVTDDQGVTVSCPQDTLAVGESMTCTASGVATLGQYENVGSVSATAPDESTVTDDDPSHYLGVAVPVPGIDIEKATNGQDADSPTGPQIVVGGSVSWTYEVTNTGNVDLFDVVVTDDQGVTVSCPQDALAVGDSMTCTASGTASLGQYENVGSVTAYAPDESTVSDSDPSHYLGVTLPPPPSDFTIRIEKVVTTSNGGTAPAAGTEFEFDLDCVGLDRTFALADGESYSVTLTSATRCSLTETNDQGASSTTGEFSDLLIEGARTFTVVNNYEGVVVLGTSISKQLTSADPANIGETVTFDVTIGFEGDTLAAVELVDIYENAYLDFQSASADGFTLACEEVAATPDAAHNTVVCDLGDLLGETTVQVSFTALQATTPDRTLNEANADYDGPTGRVRIGPAFDDVEIVEVLGLPPLGDGPVAPQRDVPLAAGLVLAAAAVALAAGVRQLVGGIDR